MAEISRQLKAAQDSFVEIERLCDGCGRILVILEIFEVGQITLRVDEIEAIGKQTEEGEDEEAREDHGGVLTGQSLRLPPLHAFHLYWRLL